MEHIDDEDLPDLLTALMLEFYFERSRYSMNLQDFKVNRAKFQALTTDLERFELAYTNHGQFPELIRVDKSGKCDKLGKLFKDMANDFFTSGHHEKALSTYSRCIAAAKSKDLLAILYSNRSALLIKMCRYRECLNDIDRAFANNYAGKNKKQLIERKKKAGELALKPTEPYHEEVPQFSEEEKNPKIECASNLVEIKKSKRYGRHVVATKDINVGDILAIEKAYVCDVKNYQRTYCPHCLELCYDLIACDFCTEILFCSDACKTAAYDSYHKYECKINTSQYVWTSPFLVALRATFRAKNDFDNFEQLSIFEEGEFYRSNRFKEVHNLSINKSLSVVEKIKIATHAAIMFFFVKTHTSFFDGFEDKAAAEDKFKVILMRQMQIVQVNVVNVVESYSVVTSDEDCHYAHGIFPFYSLFNHSCDPNVEAFFHGSTMVVRAILPIKKGEQCFVNYQCYYGSAPKNERQDILKSRYGFKCECRACREDWQSDLIAVRGLDLASKLEFVLNADFEIQRLSTEVTSGGVNCRKLAHKLIKLLLKKLRTMEPNRLGLFAYYKNLARSCFEVFGNKRIGISYSA